MKSIAPRKIGIMLIVAVLFAFHYFTQREAHADAPVMSGWKEVYTSTGDCRIAFPSLPQMVQQNLKLEESGKKLTYDLYLAPYQDRGVCLLLIAHYPAPMTKGHELAGLEGLIRGIVGHHPENQLVFAEVKDLQGFPSVTFLIQSGKNYFRGQGLMVGSKLYLIAMEGKKHQFEEPIFQHFLKSFQLIVP